MDFWELTTSSKIKINILCDMNVYITNMYYVARRCCSITYNHNHEHDTGTPWLCKAGRFMLLWSSVTRVCLYAEHNTTWSYIESGSDGDLRPSGCGQIKLTAWQVVFSALKKKGEKATKT